MHPSRPPAAAPDPARAGPYGLSRPDLAEARCTVRRVYGDQADGIWAGVLAAAGLTGAEDAPTAVERLADAMRRRDPVLGLCGHSLHIRVSAFDHLAAAEHAVRSY